MRLLQSNSVKLTHLKYFLNSRMHKVSLQTIQKQVSSNSMQLRLPISKLKIILPLLCPLMLAACSTSPARIPVPLEPPASLLQKCPVLEQWEYSDTNSLVESNLNVINGYYSCSNIHNSLVDWIQNTIKDSKTISGSK